jgi:hypothetical protein
MSTLFGSLQNKMDWLHNAVIIAFEHLLVNHKKAPKSGAFAVVLEYYFLEVAV